jgi:hypothetical protein
MWTIWSTMDAVVVVFHLPTGTPLKVHKDFRRKVYGEATSSWKGRYRYRRKGVLDGIPHVFLYWGVVIINRRDLPALRDILDHYSAIIQVRTVITIREDEIVLGWPLN